MRKTGIANPRSSRTSFLSGRKRSAAKTRSLRERFGFESLRLRQPHCPTFDPSILPDRATGRRPGRDGKIICRPRILSALAPRRADGGPTCGHRQLQGDA